MMSSEERIMEAVKKASVDGKLSCTKARQLAAELGVPVRKIGEAADTAKIKIFACELGCF
ncbi:MAG TPA: hypothetical protein GX711_04675 [Clostridia bacterium]|nr:hypothetical protein [Clostridia bacterium]